MRTDNAVPPRTFDYVGLHRYSLTFYTDRRRHLFSNPGAVALVLKQISRAAIEHRFAVIAYCFMPDCVHLLIEGQSDLSDGKRFISRAKQYSGFYYSKAYRHTLWQRHGLERVLQEDEPTLRAARDVLENPVRAGLVQRVQDYPFLGSLTYSLDQLL